ncbi:MAG TPA: hypothetical protein VMV89_12180 [Candidatus Paceibacterota bacterium]|nr:hypothetical protein [Candidatus Paceibacterota bacterium]
MKIHHLALRIFFDNGRRLQMFDEKIRTRHQFAENQIAGSRILRAMAQQFLQQNAMQRQARLFVVLADRGAHHHRGFFRIQIHIAPAKFFEFTMPDASQRRHDV